MKFPWFKRIGIVFIPVTFPGWIILLASLLVAVYSFVDIDSRSHSASDTLRNFAFQFLIIWAAYSLLSYLTSRKPE